MPLKTDTIEEPDLNLTPMIDIVFLLIIFFMVGSQFTEPESHYPIDLPTVSNAPPLTDLPDEITINIDTEGVVRIQEEVFTLEELEQRLKQAHDNYADQAVVVRGSGSGQYQPVMDVLAVCERAEISKVSLANRVQSGEE